MLKEEFDNGRKRERKPRSGENKQNKDTEQGRKEGRGERDQEEINGKSVGKTKKRKEINR